MGNIPEGAGSSPDDITAERDESVCRGGAAVCGARGAAVRCSCCSPSG